MNGPVFAFLMALVCIVAMFLPWWGRLLLIPLAVAITAWAVHSAWKLHRLYNPKGELPLIFPDND